MHRLSDVSMWLDDFPGDAPPAVTGPLNFLVGNREHVDEFATATQTPNPRAGPAPRPGARRTDRLERFEGRAHLIDLTKRGRDTTARDLRDEAFGRKIRGAMNLNARITPREPRAGRCAKWQGMGRGGNPR